MKLLTWASGTTTRKAIAAALCLWIAGSLFFAGKSAYDSGVEPHQLIGLLLLLFGAPLFVASSYLFMWLAGARVTAALVVAIAAGVSIPWAIESYKQYERAEADARYRAAERCRRDKLQAARDYSMRLHGQACGKGCAAALPYGTPFEIGRCTEDCAVEVTTRLDQWTDLTEGRAIETANLCK